MGTDYETASRTYDNTRKASSPVASVLASRARFNAETNVLDFGCGTGNYLHELSRAYPSRFYGVEPSEGMRARAVEKNPGIEIVSGDHRFVPFPDIFFDCVYMTDVIHHVPDVPMLFRTLGAKLRRDGLMCVVTESHEQIGSRWYNAYFPSLAANELARYPDMTEIAGAAASCGLASVAIDLINHGSEYQVTAEFIRMVEEKNYSMFRNLSDDEFSVGLARLRADVGKVVRSGLHGESALWFKK